jgi:tetratricopeptide (TPR) repeat protein
VIESRADHEYAQAIAAIDAAATPLEKIDMLVEMALELQQKPKTVVELERAVELYDRALELSAGSDPLLSARVRVHKASALRALPGPGTQSLLLARAELESALEVLASQGGSSEELGVAQMSLGVVLQSLAAEREAKITDAIAAYQRASRVFDRERYPRDFAILQNNLATAYLSIPMSDERAKMREALAVQAFGEALKVVSLVDDPIEYAMLQNNLGNALQYAASGHPVENGLRALEAYDEALKVRNARNMPVQYANTIANKANCLRNLPDDASDDALGAGLDFTRQGDTEGSLNEGEASVPNPRRLFEAARLYAHAAEIFRRHGELERAEIVEQARVEIVQELGQAHSTQVGHWSDSRAPEFGQSRI